VSDQVDGLPSIGVRVHEHAAITPALRAGGIEPGRPVAVIVGGAGGMDESTMAALESLVLDAVVPVLDAHGAAVVDGGTDSGVMRLIGRARARRNARFALVGVAASGTVAIPGDAPAVANPAELEPNHSLFLLVPGTHWGDEAPWIDEVATVLAGEHPSVTILVNGGQIAYQDVEASLRRGRPVVIAKGSGRTADAIAAARGASGAPPRDAEIAASPLVTIAPIDLPSLFAEAVGSALDGPRHAGDGS